MTDKPTEAHLKANRKWDDKNKKRKQYINKRSVARNFIKQLATDDDLAEMQTLISDRHKFLKENS
ncbi:hypothetical protein [Lactiplantibacillus plantarum]|uniref:hypothetical protein n=1 Tax=Lactiplantibacillus plantarum TaxID=1590 RepID=UPI0003165EF9|nr:hypothetical protein [Lactiplantibacillus plantarum]ALF14415.1 hypothetical protein AKJ11_04605 [Lactiplantibacillus plantarum]AWI40591.1 hypothetical protein LpLQ80_08665 [Lactiplantibacillus plantarum]MDE4415427.1 hypothetical protein [Lactiplantibacillus plantarum]MDE4417996.1 hypothetical protein [Lactiplantibacillus plantarum]MDE4421221.1 hypothetical protein [Lactiplantibacillus plantarum]